MVVCRDVSAYLAIKYLSINAQAAFKPTNSYSTLLLFFPRIKQAYNLIMIVTISFINFVLYSGKKFYLIFVFTPVDYGLCKSTPSIFSEVLQSVQVQLTI